MVVPTGGEPADEVEKFSQLTRAATGHIFPAAELQAIVDTFCTSGQVECRKPALGALSLELGGVGSIEVAPGQSPGEAVDAFLVRARAGGFASLSEEGVEQVLDYFCARKPCAVPLAPIGIEVRATPFLARRARCAPRPRAAAVALVR